MKELGSVHASLKTLGFAPEHISVFVLKIWTRRAEAKLLVREKTQALLIRVNRKKGCLNDIRET